MTVLLPASTVQLVFNICKKTKISVLDETTILLNLHYAIHKISKVYGFASSYFSEKSICLFLMNIVRLSLKTVGCEAKMSTQNLNELFGRLKITVNEINASERDVLTKIDFKLLESPLMLELIHDWCERLLVETTGQSIEELTNLAYKFLKVFFAMRSEIYIRWVWISTINLSCINFIFVFRVNSQPALTKLQRTNTKVVVAAIVLNVGRMHQLSDREHNILFDKLIQIADIVDYNLFNCLSMAINSVVFWIQTTC